MSAVGVIAAEPAYETFGTAFGVALLIGVGVLSVVWAIGAVRRLLDA
jgi:hypothetical protein